MWYPRVCHHKSQTVNFMILACLLYLLNIDIPSAKWHLLSYHYSDVIMKAMASHITGFSIVYSTLFRCDKKNFKAPHHCEGNPPVTDGFSSQRASDVKNVSIWWRHYVRLHCVCGGCWSMEYPSETILKLKSRDFAFPSCLISQWPNRYEIFNRTWQW